MTDVWTWWTCSMRCSALIGISVCKGGETPTQRQAWIERERALMQCQRLVRPAVDKPPHVTGD